MKKLIIIIAWVLSLGAQAQNDSIDQCQFMVYYDYLINTTDKDGNAVRDSMQLAVLVGTHTAMCMEYNDAMMDCYNEFKDFDYQMGWWNARKYNLPTIFVGYPDGQMSSFDKITPNRYFYSEPLPDFSWQLSSDTLTVGGYLCQKAVGQYGGRTWTVWFAEDIAVSYGPWKLRGLPGMILKAEDKDGIFHFNLAGLLRRPAAIKYLSMDHYSKTSREKFIANKNKIFCNKKYVQQPNYYIPQGTYEQLGVKEMWAKGDDYTPENALSVVSYDMIIPKKVNAYQPLELK